MICLLRHRPSLEKHVAEIRAMYGGVAHGARLIFRRLVVRGACGPLGRECVTLQTEQVDEAYPQHAWIGRAVWHMTAATSFGLDRHVLVYEGALLVGMALVANGIAAGKSAHLAQNGCPVGVVAVAALDQTFLDPVMIGLGEICLYRSVTAIAQRRLLLDQ